MSAAVNTNSMPISTVLLFAIDDDFTLYFAARKGSYKVNALEKDQRISMSDWVYKNMLVQMSGTASEVTGDEVGPVLDKIAESVIKVEDFWPPVLRIHGGEYQAFKVKITWIRALDLTMNLIKDTDSTFTEYTFN